MKVTVRIFISNNLPLKANSTVGANSTVVCTLCTNITVGLSMVSVTILFRRIMKGCVAVLSTLPTSAQNQRPVRDLRRLVIVTSGIPPLAVVQDKFFFNFRNIVLKLVISWCSTHYFSWEKIRLGECDMERVYYFLKLEESFEEMRKVRCRLANRNNLMQVLLNGTFVHNTWNLATRTEIRST